MKKEAIPFSPYQEVVNLLKTAGISYQVIDHQPVFTSEEAEKITGMGLDRGMKCLLVTGEGSFSLAVIPEDQRLDMKIMAKLMGVKKAQLASREEVEEIMACRVGSCYPFGSIADLRTIADPSLLDKGKLVFSPGRNDKTITILAQDYFDLAAPEKVKITS